MQKRYEGGCHCGKVAFKVNLDLSKQTGRCNCSYCSKTWSWGAIVRPEAFNLKSEAAEEIGYRFGSRSNEHVFCRHCGVHTLSRGNIEAIGGDFVSVQIAALDGIEDRDLAAIPVIYQDGRNNNWREAPTVTSYL